MDELAIVAAGRAVPEAIDRIRRYCGLPWSGGPPETWAWPYFDAVPTAPDNVVGPVDVLCAAALHPGLSRNDLAWFRAHQDDLAAWLNEIPVVQRLWELSEQDVRHIVSLPDALEGPSISLLSKVLHRKRPDAIPLLDRHVIDWYRPVTGKRSAVEAWGEIVVAIRDEESDGERRVLTAVALAEVNRDLWSDLGPDERPGLSWIRAKDIAIWMGSQ